MTQYFLPWMNGIMKTCTHIFTLKLHVVLYTNPERWFSFCGVFLCLFVFLFLRYVFVETEKLKFKDVYFAVMFCLKISPNIL